MTKRLLKSFWGDFFGAFSDGAILFPIIAALVLESGYSGALLLGTAGAAYIAAGLIFRVPMSVQPLKAVCIGAIAAGASLGEIRAAGFLVALFCLSALFVDGDRLEKKIPRQLIHGIQLVLGIILVLKGIEYGGFSATGIFSWPPWLPIGLAAVMIVIGYRSSFPLVGIVAIGGLFWSVFLSTPLAMDPVSRASSFRPLLILSLVLPQIVLTTSNSVVSTKDVAKRYFKNGASRVTIRNLFSSVGVGNVFTALLGGLPFCHGAGGLTAHVKGGSRSWRTNLIIGTTLLGLSLYLLLSGKLALLFPAPLVAALLVTVGVFHLSLAKPSWEVRTFRPTLLAMGIIGGLSMNMLWALLAGIIVHLATSRVFRTKELVA